MEPGRNDGQILKITDIGLLESGGGESGDGYRHSLEALVAPPRGDDDIAQTIRGIGLFCRLRRTSGWAGSGSSPSPRRAEAGILRSEEHTSELQSLMRISYAVFCLKNKHK